MAKDYVTIKEKTVFVYEEKKSTFTATLVPVNTEEEAVSFVASIKAEYPDARHNVYAYSVISDSGVTVKRYSDDGEPKGTAGMPVLEAVRQSGLDNVAVVVTRYFGGILLGASGLTRAYANTAGGALNAAPRRKMYFCKEMKLTFDYGMYGKIQKYIEPLEIAKKAPEFGSDVTICVAVPENEAGSFEKNITDLTSALCKIETLGDGFYEIE